MSTERLNSNPAILHRIVADRSWGESDFFLVDVGASGGIEWYWQPFGDRLRAIGFEPLVAEAERLQQLAQGSKVRYEAAFVTCRDFDALFPPDLRSDPIRSKNNQPFPRYSAVRAHELLRMNYVEQVFNAGAPAQYADRHIVLGDYVPPDERAAVDFIKIDTDGHDFPVLIGTEELLRAGGVLGFSIEAQFHGASHDYANTFDNIDRFMRSHGFSLFDLESYRYTRAALPGPFAYDIPAQTLTGQVSWGEAVYFRDLAMADYDRMWPYEITRERVIKLACLYDLFGLPDCAAELLLVRRELVGEAVSGLLDDLATGVSPAPISYDEYIRRFEADPQALYPSRRFIDAGGSVSLSPAMRTDTALPDATEAPPIQEDSESEEVRVLRKRIERQEKKIAKLQERVRRRNDRIEQLVRAVSHDDKSG